MLELELVPAAGPPVTTVVATNVEEPEVMVTRLVLGVEDGGELEFEIVVEVEPEVIVAEPEVTVGEELDD